MKHNADKMSRKGEILSLLSILSIVLLFFLVCLLAMTFLYQAGAYKLPWFWNKNGSEPVSTEQGRNTLEALLDEKDVKREYSRIETDDEALKKLVMAAPTDDSFFARVSVMRISEGTMVTEIYEMWRDGEKFIIKEYDESLVPKSTVVCDGSSISISDSETGKTESFPVSEKYSFGAMSPFPDFSLMSDEQSRIIYRQNDGETFELICDMPSGAEIADVTLSMSTGMITLAQIYRNGSPELIFTLLSYSADAGSAQFDG